MNKNIIIAIVAIIVLAALGIGIFSMKGQKSSTTSNPSTSTQVSDQKTKTSSVAELFQKAMNSGSLKCTFSSQNTSGITYIKNGNVKFTVNDAATKKVIHSILKNKIMWTWSEGDTKGMMFDMSQMEANVTPSQSQVTSPEDIQKQIEANQPNCTEESISDSVFETPKNVTFTDLSKIMKSIPKISIPAGYEIPADIPTE